MMTNLHDAKTLLPVHNRAYGCVASPSGDILSGRAQPLAMPSTFNAVPNHPSISFQHQTAEVAVWNALYAKLDGYEMEWGHILQDCPADSLGATFHFIPTELIEMGIRSEVLAAVATDWFESHQDVLAGYIDLVDGPTYVPLSISSDFPAIHEWMAQIFLPMHFRELLYLWNCAASGAGVGAAAGQPALPASRHPVQVTVIHKRIIPNQEKLQLILMTNPSEGGRMSFVMWERHQSITISDWISIPRTNQHYMQPTTDFILDFHRSGDCVIFETTMRLHEPAIVNLVDGLLAAATAGVAAAVVQA